MTTSDDTTPNTQPQAAAARREPVETAKIVSDKPEPETDNRSARQVAIDEAKEIVGVILVALVLVMILRTLLFQPFTIPSASMEPNLYQGDYIIISKWNYGISKYSFPLPFPVVKGRWFNHQAERGDVVVFKLPRDPKIDYIKRIIGVPGDVVQMKQDKLYINGAWVPSTGSGSIDVINAATEEVMGRVPDGTPADVDAFLADLGA